MLHGIQVGLLSGQLTGIFVSPRFGAWGFGGLATALELVQDD